MPSSIGLALQRGSEAEAQPGCPEFEADILASEPQLLQHARRHVRRGFAVGMAAELRRPHLLFDRDALHGPGDEDILALKRDDEQMRREITPVIKAGQIEDIFG